MTGTIARLYPIKNFGFIEVEGYPQDFFFHLEDCLDNFKNMTEGMKVTFLDDKTPKGLRARNVAIIKEN